MINITVIEFGGRREVELKRPGGRQGVYEAAWAQLRRASERQPGGARGLIIVWCRTRSLSFDIRHPIHNTLGVQGERLSVATQELLDGTFIVLFTDVVGSKELTNRPGEAAARDVLGAGDYVVR